MKFMRYLTPVLAACLLAACVTPGRVSDTQNSDLLARHAAGQATLECGLACVPVFGFNLQRIQELQRTRDWDGLAVTVMRADWRQDIGYFLLGLAAEGQKHYLAADRYYRMAGALATGQSLPDKCASVRELCLGFNLPKDIAPRLRAIAQFVPAPMSPTASVQAAGKDNPLSLAAAGVDLIPDAPQTLLGQYAARRIMASSPATAARDAQFREQLLKVFEPALAQQTRGNEIAGTRAAAALLERLGNEVVETRLALGMHVQLKNFDPRSKSFELHYPLHARSGAMRLEPGIYRGSAQRNKPWSDYSNTGTSCVWEPGNDYSRLTGQDAFFVMLTLCHPHPATRQLVAPLDEANAEVPPVFQLNVPRDALWPRLMVDGSQAEGLIRRMGSSRLAWAELVFDVRAINQGNAGPFSRRQVIELKQAPALTVDIQPRALVVWELANGSNGPGPLIGSVGELQPLPIPRNARLPRALVADRVYPTRSPQEPVPAVRPANATAPAPVQTRPRPAVTAPAAVLPQPVKTNKGSSDEDDWIEPPAAKR